MKNNSLKFISVAACALALASYFRSPQSTTIEARTPSTPQIVAAQAALSQDGETFLIRFLSTDLNNRLDNYYDCLTFIEAIKQYAPDFGACAESSSNEMWNALQEAKNRAPEAVQEAFGALTQQEFDVLWREKQAISYFQKLLSTNDKATLPLWSTFAQKMVTLLEGNEAFAGLRNGLASVINPGWSGKIAIGRALRPYFNRKTLPKGVYETLHNLGVSGVMSKIRFK